MVEQFWDTLDRFMLPVLALIAADAFGREVKRFFLRRALATEITGQSAQTSKRSEKHSQSKSAATEEAQMLDRQKHAKKCEKISRRIRKMRALNSLLARPLKIGQGLMSEAEKSL